MDDYIISGIQQIGIGVDDLKTAWKHYIQIFKMDVRVLEDDSVAELMLPYTGNKPQKRHAAIAINMQGGGGFEIWQYSGRKPQKADFDIHIGDLGIFAAKIKSRNVNLTYDILSKYPSIKVLSKPRRSIDNCHSFFVEDMFGNMFQIVHSKYVFSDEKRSTGGPIGAIIGVSDIDKAMPVYRDILGYDKVIFDGEDEFNEYRKLKGGTERYRRVLLTHTDDRKGPFSKLFGRSYIELVQALDREPVKIFKNRYWGDLGFIHLCFDIRNMKALEKKCENLGFPFTVDSSKGKSEVFDMGEAAGIFTYIEDPDGTLIEFVETHKIPVVKKLGININLMKRNPEKALPKYLLKGLKFGRVKGADL